jgi:hypothetical protein
LIRDAWLCRDGYSAQPFLSLVQCSVIHCYSEFRHFTTVLSHYIILSPILDLVRSLICTEARADVTAHTGGRWVSTHAWGHIGRSCAGCGCARSPGSIGLCLADPGDGPMGLSPYVINSDVIYIYIVILQQIHHHHRYEK